MIPRSATSKSLLLKQQTRGGAGCSFFFPNNRSSADRAHLAVLGSAGDEKTDCKKHLQSDPSRNDLQQQQFLLAGLVNVTQTQQSARNHALDFPREVQQHPCVLATFYHPIRPSDQRTRQYVQLQQQHRHSTSQSQSSSANAYKINQDLAACKDAIQVLKVLGGLPGALSQPAGGCVLNAVNLSTALNRLAKHSAGHHKTRVAVLQDARFALLVAALAEALYDNNNNNNNKRIVFAPQALSTIAWALAKLKLRQPKHVKASADWRNGEKNNSDTSSSLSGMARVVRQAVLKAAQQWQPQQNSGDSASTTPVESSTWMPALTQLAGHILDDIGNKVTVESNNSRDASRQFQVQEYANLLWAWATVGRADPVVVETVIQHMIRQQENELLAATAYPVGLKPYIWTYSLWAITTARMYHCHEDLLEFIAYLLITYPDFLNQFKASDISSSVWATATLLVNKPAPLTYRERIAALTIARCAAQYVLCKGAGSFKPKDLSITIWSMATLGFGLASSPEQKLNNNRIELESDDPARDAEMMKKVVDKIARAYLPLLRRLTDQQLKNLPLTLAHLGDVRIGAIDELLDGIERQMQYRQRPSC